ncbi:MAG: glucuronate isomerase [Ferruginibacter sp.]|nr:glucuronate isomerase [Ferruginibacter sp.]
MKAFLEDNFLLHSTTAQTLYHSFARQMPIIDYHCHLPPADISGNTRFKNLTQIWLYGDHYKWRAMRANGVDESFITGNKTDKEKFLQYAATVPYTLRNPLYHWTHLELQRYFDVPEILNERSAERIYDSCSEKLRSPEYSVQSLLRKMNVQVVCTTDDPLDSLQYHQQIKSAGFATTVIPAFRPDAAMNVDIAANFNKYIAALENVADTSIVNYTDFLAALKRRHDFFSVNGCTISDHGVEEIYADDFTAKEIDTIFNTIRSGKEISLADNRKFKSAMLLVFAGWDFDKGWVQQYHIGAIRNNNSRMSVRMGTDTGWDSIGNFNHAKPLAKFLNTLDKEDKLTKTILYNLNPADNELMATMIGNFNDGSVAGKIQWGSAWWFLDQKDGMAKQLNTLSNMGLLSKFVGMVTDSRSFLSYPRHEYFRRVLCNLFGSEIEKGELPNDIDWTGKIIQDICYYNAKNYCNW